MLKRKGSFCQPVCSQKPGIWAEKAGAGCTKQLPQKVGKDWMPVSNLPKSKQPSDTCFFFLLKHLQLNIELTRTKHVCHLMKILGKHPFFSALDTSHSIPPLFIPFPPPRCLRIPPRPLRALVVIPRCAKRPYTFSALHQAVWGWRWLELCRCRWNCWRQRIAETSFKFTKETYVSAMFECYYCLSVSIPESLPGLRYERLLCLGQEQRVDVMGMLSTSQAGLPIFFKTIISNVLYIFPLISSRCWIISECWKMSKGSHYGLPACDKIMSQSRSTFLAFL